MIASVHVADLSAADTVRALRAHSGAQRVPGMRMGDVLIAARLGGAPHRKAIPGRVALVAAWDDDAALDAWLERAPLAKRLAGGWHVRLQPLRAYGAWRSLDPLFAGAEEPAEDGEPVVVITYGRPRVKVLHRFLAASQAAEDRAVADPAMVAGTALARPLGLVCTFSVWRTAAEMRAYAVQSHEHLAAMKGMREHDFHHESIFARFRPYRAEGLWDGREPVSLAAEAARRAAANVAPGPAAAAA